MARRTADIRAAGGVVWRVRDGEVEVALVHRARYDDWSLPKGKLEAGESELSAAVREVGEELGSQVAVSRRLGDVEYDVGSSRKRVTFWVMAHRGGQFVANAEVDVAEWLTPPVAMKRMSYEVERRVLSDFLSVPIAESVIVLVRHAKAGKRSEWSGPDALRPLDQAGRRQAARLADLVQAFVPDRLVSGEPLRCRQTVAPLAALLGLPVEIDPVFNDAAFTESPVAVEAAVFALARPRHVTVVCSQGTAIPGLIDRLGRGVRRSDTRKAAAWVLCLLDGTVVSTDYYEDAISD